jgi:DNA-binding MarR family transcriptional regulator
VKELADELIAICRHIGAYERESVCCGTVTVPQCLVLQQLRAGPLDMGALASSAGSSVSAMTRLVDGIERRGWAERVRDAEDRRRVVVQLTAAGAGEADRLRASTDELLAVLFERIPADRRAQVIESLRLVRQALDALDGTFGSCCAVVGDDEG